MKVVSLIGARPQYIKEAAVNKALKKAKIKEIIVNSGQHYDYNMADVFFKTLKITPPDYNLKVGSGLHGEMTAKIIAAFEKLMMKVNPDVILVYGDTNTTLAGAIVATKLKIKLAHVEAGIRMLPKDMPEEINRTLADRVSNLLFCCSERGVENLKNEGMTEGVYNTGDVMYDVFVQTKKKFDYSLYEDLKLKNREFVLVTIHRDYNVDDKKTFKKILEALNEVAKNKRVIYPMHPRSKKMAKKFGLEKLLKNIDIMKPIDYLSLMGLMQHCSGVITDSGGVQREAYFSKKPAYILMPDPAWHELVEKKMNYLCTSENLCSTIKRPRKYNCIPNIYGNGHAAEKIVNILKKECVKR